VYKIISQTF